MLKVLLLILVLVATSAPAVSQDFPTRPLTMVIAWPPGSASDIAARLFARHAEKYLGQPIVAQNKVGGDGAIAWAETLRARPDGYTLTVVNFDILTNQAKGSDLKYESFDYIQMFTFQPMCMYVRGSSPFKSLQDLVAAARARPGQVNLAVTGLGGFLHQAAYLVERKYDIKLNMIPYKGTSEILNAELGGQVDADLNLITLTQHHVRSGALRALLCFTHERLPDYASVPTITELGINDSDFSSWRAVAVGKGVPDNIRSQLRAAFLKAYQDPEFQAAAKKGNFDLRYMDHEQMIPFLERQYPAVRDSVRALGFGK